MGVLTEALVTEGSLVRSGQKLEWTLSILTIMELEVAIKQKHL